MTLTSGCPFVPAPRWMTLASLGDAMTASALVACSRCSMAAAPSRAESKATWASKSVLGPYNLKGRGP